MSYEYGDSALKVVVGSANGKALVGVRYEPADEFGNLGYTKVIPPDEAPAMALAILEAAGITQDIKGNYSERATRLLADHEKFRVKQSEVDAEVARYRSEALGRDGGCVFAWDELDEASKERARAEYRRVRAFFEKES